MKIFAPVFIFLINPFVMFIFHKGWDNGIFVCSSINRKSFVVNFLVWTLGGKIGTIIRAKFFP